MVKSIEARQLCNRSMSNAGRWSLFVDKEICYLATVIVTAQELPMFFKNDLEEMGTKSANHLVPIYKKSFFKNIKNIVCLNHF